MYNGLGLMYVTEPRKTWTMSPGYSSDDDDYGDDINENLFGVRSTLAGGTQTTHFKVLISPVTKQYHICRNL